MLKLTILKHARLLNPVKMHICSFKQLSSKHNQSDKMPSSLTTNTKITTKEQAKQELATKDDMKWRTPWHEKEGQHYSMLRSFYEEKTVSPFLRFVQQPINLSPASIKQWWAKRKEEQTISLQQYLPERNQILGNELAAAHFLVHRGGAVKFFGDDKWIKANDFNEYELPTYFKDDLYLQAIDCTNMQLYYEGMVNMRNLKQLEWLSLNGCEKLDDWALDKVGHLYSHSLLYLDIRNMPEITHRGIGCLYKLEQLKILYVDEIFASKEFEITCLMLQDVNPNLDIRIEY